VRYPELGLETWSLTVREEHRLRMFLNRVLRKILAPKRDEVTGKRKRLHNENLVYTTHYVLFG